VGQTKVVSSISATRANAIVFGVLSGLAGMEHGFFEVLQGSVVPSGLVIDAIGPSQRFWELGTEPAMTIVPNFLVTGILAMIVGLAIIVWSSAFVQRRYGAHVLAILAIVLLLFGGGFAPVESAIVAIIVASRIDKPLTWWRTHLPVAIRGFLARSWKWSLSLCAAGYLFCIVSAILGGPLLLVFAPGTTNSMLLAIGLGVLALMLYAIPAGFAYDIQKQAQSPATGSIRQGLEH
jgi:hypothetical protein